VAEHAAVLVPTVALVVDVPRLRPPCHRARWQLCAAGRDGPGGALVRARLRADRQSPHVRRPRREARPPRGGGALRRDARLCGCEPGPPPATRLIRRPSRARIPPRRVLRLDVVWNSSLAGIDDVWINEPRLDMQGYHREA